MYRELVTAENLTAFRAVELLCFNIISFDYTIIQLIKYFLFPQLNFCSVVGGVNKEHFVTEVKVQLSQRGPTGMAAPELFLSSMVQNSNRKHFSMSTHRNGSSEKGQLIFLGSYTTKQITYWIICIKPWIATTHQIKIDLYNDCRHGPFVIWQCKAAIYARKH